MPKTPMCCVMWVHVKEPQVVEIYVEPSDVGYLSLFPSFTRIMVGASTESETVTAPSLSSKQ